MILEGYGSANNGHALVCQLFIYSQGKHFSVDVRGILDIRWYNFTCWDVYTKLYQFISCSHIWREFFCIAINIEWPMHCVKLCPYSEFGPQSVRMRENTDQNNSEYGYFLRSDAIKDYEIQKLKAKLFGSNNLICCWLTDSRTGSFMSLPYVIKLCNFFKSYDLKKDDEYALVTFVLWYWAYY